jgi:hypothetical protein
VKAAALYILAAFGIVAFYTILVQRWRGQQRRILSVLRGGGAFCTDDAPGYVHRSAVTIARDADVPIYLIHVHLASMIQSDLVLVKPDPRSTNEKPRHLYHLRLSCRSVSIETMESILRNPE